MNKKYQIFVSSTYTDLVEERQAVSLAILDLGHIPAGMEMFPAADTEQLAYIKKIIDECDYYVLIIGGRYGSIDSAGVSYTEREYDYAASSNKTVLAFLHRDIDKMPLGRTDKDDSRRGKLFQFMNKVSSGRLVQKWETVDELRSKAVISLTKAFADSPQVGWLRTNSVPSEAVLMNSLKYREENDALRARIRAIEADETFRPADALDLSGTFSIKYSVNYGTRTGSKEITYLDFFKSVALTLMPGTTLYGATQAMKRGLVERFSYADSGLDVHQNSVQDALVQLMACGLVKMIRNKADTGEIIRFQLTPQGVRTWQEQTYVKKPV